MSGGNRRFNPLPQWDAEYWLGLVAIMFVGLIVAGTIAGFMYKSTKEGDNSFKLKDKQAQICLESDDPEECQRKQEILKLCGDQQEEAQVKGLVTFDIQTCLDGKPQQLAG